MRIVALATLIAVIVAGTLALAPGTYSMTDVKAPVFAGGVFFAALAVFLAAAFTRDGARAHVDASLSAAAAACLVFTALSYSWAAHRWVVSFAFTGQFILLLAAVAVTFVACRGRSWPVLATTYIALGAAAALANLIWHGFYARNLNDVRVPLGNANLLGAFLLMPIGMSVSLLAGQCRSKRRMAVLLPVVVALVLCIIVFVLCRSLSACLGLGVYLVTFALLELRRKRLFAVTVVLAAVALVAVLHFSGGFTRFSQSRTYLLRMEYWRRALVMTLKRPLLGFGAGNYFTNNQPLGVETSHTPVTFTENGVTSQVPLYQVLGDHLPASAHNEYLQRAAEGGLVGLALYAALLAVPLWRAWTARRRGFPHRHLLDGAIAVYIAWLVTNSVTSNMRFADFAPHFWITAGLLASSAPLGRPRPVKLPKVGKAILGIVATAAAAWGVYSFAIGDYSAARDYWTGVGLYKNRDYKRAQPFFKRAAGLTWDNYLHVDSLNMLGQSYLAGGEIQSAREVFEKADSEVDGMMGYQVGRTLELMGRYEAAFEAYSKHAADRPAAPSVKRRLMFTEMMAATRRKAGNAAELADRYFQAYPDDATARRFYMLELLGAGENVDLARLRLLALKIERPPVNPVDMYLVGRLDYLEKKLASAAELMNRAYEAGFRGYGINFHLALALTDLGRVEDAKRILDEGLRGGDRERLGALAKRIDALIAARDSR